MHHLDFLDICAILLGILFTIAKLDAQGRSSSNFEHVPAQDFERWRTWTMSIYRLGSAACFIRVLFHQGWAFYLSRQPLTGPVFNGEGGAELRALPRSLMIPPLLVDAAFLALLVATFIRANRARGLRRELGIVLSPATPQQQALRADEDEKEP